MVDTPPADDASDDRPPRAWTMALLAFLHFNIGLGVIWGSFSVLLGAVEQRLGVGRTASTMAVPLLTLTAALIMPVLGELLAKRSLRAIALLGSVMIFAGFLILATVPTYLAYLLTFGLLLGPGQAIAVIAPVTLVTRWFRSGHGRALGIGCSPIVIAVIPLISNAALQRFGLSQTYALLAMLVAVLIVTNLFIVDTPPASAANSVAETPQSVQSPALTTGAILRLPFFWFLLGAFVPLIMGAIILSAHLVPLAESWGLSTEAAVGLVSVQSLAGIVGTVFLGWLADRIGGARTVAFMALACALLWSCFLLAPSFTPAALIVGLIGMCAAGVTPVTNHALAETIGRDSFSRAFGLINLFILPFSVAGTPLAAMIYGYSGSYMAVVSSQVGLFLLALIFALLAIRAGRVRRV